MAKTASLNSGEISGINNRRLTISSKLLDEIFTFHVNEIYFSHVKTAIDGKTKGPGAMQDGALLNNTKTI